QRQDLLPVLPRLSVTGSRWRQRPCRQLRQSSDEGLLRLGRFDLPLEPRPLVLQPLDLVLDPLSRRLLRFGIGTLYDYTAAVDGSNLQLARRFALYTDGACNGLLWQIVDDDRMVTCREL